MHARWRARDADLYRPAGKGPFPLLLMRQPYGRKIASTVVYAILAGTPPMAMWSRSRTCGSGTSEGDFKLPEHEREDGADTLAWAAALEGCNGRIGMYGSLPGGDQFLALAGALDGGAPLPAALCPAMMGWDVYSDWAYEGGAFCLAGGMSWALQMGAERARFWPAISRPSRRCAAARNLPINEEVTAWPAVLQRYKAYTHYAD